MTAESTTAAIVVAAGRGERMGASVAKAFLPLAGQPLLARAVGAVEACPLVDRIVVVVAQPQVAEAEALVTRSGYRRVTAVVAGGPERQDSVAAGLSHVGQPEIVVVHDGARPLVQPEVVAAVVQAARETGAASAGLPMRETVKKVDGGEATSTLDRDVLWIAHTPQAFRADLLRDAHRRAREDGVRGSDDAVLVERLGHRVRMVEDSPRNLKITVPDDLRLAEAYLRNDTRVVTRTGMGVDTHRLVMGRPLRLGGVEIPSPRGLAGHSDADVLAHAIMDAVLGAAGLGDIGHHFPPGDPAYRGADSLQLLRRVAELIQAAGRRVTHVDSVVLAASPWIAPYVPQMRERLSAALGIDAAAISIKATTTEGMGAIGRGEGITAYAIATLTTTVTGDW